MREISLSIRFVAIFLSPALSLPGASVRPEPVEGRTFTGDTQGSAHALRPTGLEESRALRRNLEDRLRTGLEERKPLTKSSKLIPEETPLYVEGKGTGVYVGGSLKAKDPWILIRFQDEKGRFSTVDYGGFSLFTIPNIFLATEKDKRDSENRIIKEPEQSIADPQRLQKLRERAAHLLNTNHPLEDYLPAYEALREARSGSLRAGHTWDSIERIINSAFKSREERAQGKFRLENLSEVERVVLDLLLPKTLGARNASLQKLHAVFSFENRSKFLPVLKGKLSEHGRISMIIEEAVVKKAFKRGENPEGAVSRWVKINGWPTARDWIRRAIPVVELVLSQEVPEANIRPRLLSEAGVSTTGLEEMRRARTGLAALMGVILGLNVVVPTLLQETTGMREPVAAHYASQIESLLLDLNNPSVRKMFDQMERERFRHEEVEPLIAGPRPTPSVGGDLSSFSVVPDAAQTEAVVLSMGDSLGGAAVVAPLARMFPSDVRIVALVPSKTIASMVYRSFLSYGMKGVQERVRFLIHPGVSSWARDPYFVLRNEREGIYTLIPARSTGQNSERELSIGPQLSAFDVGVPFLVANTYSGISDIHGGNISADAKHAYIGYTAVHRSLFDPLTSARIASPQQALEAVQKIVNKKLVVFGSEQVPPPDDHQDRYFLPAGEVKKGTPTGVLADPMEALRILRDLSQAERKEAVEAILEVVRRSHLEEVRRITEGQIETFLEITPQKLAQAQERQWVQSLGFIGEELGGLS